MNEPDGSQTVFWTKRWEVGKIPGDCGGIPPSLVSFLGRIPAPTRVLIPGCAFHEVGHDVSAIEFSPVAHAQEVLGALSQRVIHGNFFKHDFADNRYGLVYERRFLCSLPPTRWTDYAARMARLVPAGGKLVGLFLYGQEPEPPPYPLTEATAAELLGPSFKLVHSEAVTGSVPVYQGLEHWQEWERLPD